MKAMQRGFTLIELVVVIVILGILAATALPKFVDLRTEAKTAAVAGVAGGMGSAMAVNYAGCAALDFVVTANKCVKVDNCDDAGSLLVGGTPANYTITAAALSPASATATCTLTLSTPAPAVTATFTGVGT